MATSFSQCSFVFCLSCHSSEPHRELCSGAIRCLEENGQLDFSQAGGLHQLNRRRAASPENRSGNRTPPSLTYLRACIEDVISQGFSACHADINARIAPWNASLAV
jgi:hypothetical protein